MIKRILHELSFHRYFFQLPNVIKVTESWGRKLFLKSLCCLNVYQIFIVQYQNDLPVNWLLWTCISLSIQVSTNFCANLNLWISKYMYIVGEVTRYLYWWIFQIVVQQIHKTYFPLNT